MNIMVLLVIAISCFSLLFAVYLARHVVQKDMGTARMQEISNAIKEPSSAPTSTIMASPSTSGEEV